MTEKNIILTTGIYDLIKDHVRRKKVTSQEEEVLKMELKNAKQVVRRELPDNVVSVDTRVTVKDLDASQEEVYTFVAPERAKRKNSTESILSSMGLALVGYEDGDKVSWPVDGGTKNMEILKVEKVG